MTPRTRAGLACIRPVGPGARVGLVAPASPFARVEFDAGLRELKRLGFVPVYDERVFDRQEIVAGPAELRARMLLDYLSRPDIDAVLAVRGGYGSVETLPLLSAQAVRERRTALIGYSDITSLHVFLGCHAGLVSIHGPMIEGRIAAGAGAYDPASFMASLAPSPMGEVIPAGLEVLKPGEAAGPIFGGTLSQLVGSLGTPFSFDPPAGHVLLLDEVGERPYRLRRMLTHLRLAGRLQLASAIVIGQLPKCDEPDRPGSARAAIADALADFPGPVLIGYPTGHTTTALLSVPLGVSCRAVATARPAVVFEEAAAA